MNEYDQAEERAQRGLDEANERYRKAIRTSIEACDAEMALIEARSRQRFVETMVVAAFSLAAVLMLWFL